MTTQRRRRERRDALSNREYFELLIGPGSRGSAFITEEARRIAWGLHREDILQDLDLDQQPWASREYDQ